MKRLIHGSAVLLLCLLAQIAHAQTPFNSPTPEDESGGDCPYNETSVYDMATAEPLAIGEWWHEDNCKPQDMWWCDIVDDDHGPEKCSNGDASLSIHCAEWSNNSPRADEVDCKTDTIMDPFGGHYRSTSCTVFARVLCPGLGDPVPVGQIRSDWITFRTYADTTYTDLGPGACKSGILRVDATGHPDKGVSCVGRFGTVSKTAECGCHVFTGTSSVFFGRLAKTGTNSYDCLYPR